MNYVACSSVAASEWASWARATHPSPLVTEHNAVHTVPYTCQWTIPKPTSPPGPPYHPRLTCLFTEDDVTVQTAVTVVPHSFDSFLFFFSKPHGCQGRPTRPPVFQLYRRTRRNETLPTLWSPSSSRAPFTFQGRRPAAHSHQRWSLSPCSVKRAVQGVADFYPCTCIVSPG